MPFYVYILASYRNGTLYVGHTDDLINRIRQHREKELGGFTARYGVAMLVWYEAHDSRESAFKRERQIKKWYRAWKLNTIEAVNPEWRDLYDDLLKPDQPLHPHIGAALNAPAPPLIPAHVGTQACSGGGETEGSKGSLGPRIRGDEREEK